MAGEANANKEEFLAEFLRQFKIALTTAFFYESSHPYFVRHIEQFHRQLILVFSIANPIKISVTPSSLSIAGSIFQKKGLYDELAGIFHYRKVKTIFIHSDVTVEELTVFFSGLALAVKEVYRAGGIPKILAARNITRIAVEELDYAPLLQGEGQECKDIWGYLLGDTLESEDEQKINQLADNFSALLGKFPENSLLQDEKYFKSITDFLGFLKARQPEKHKSCLNEVIRAIARAGQIAMEDKISRIQSITQGLNEQEVASLIWEALFTEGNVDALSFQLLVRLSQQHDRENPAQPLLTQADIHKIMRGNLHAAKNIQRLLSSSDDQPLSEMYRNTLSALLKDISSEGNLFFDRNLLGANYRYILLNLLGQEHNEKNLKLAAAQLAGECDKAAKEHEVKFIEDVLVTLNGARRAQEDAAVFKALDESLKACIEAWLWEEDSSLRLDSLIPALDVFPEDPREFIRKMFGQPKINAQALKIFFRFFIGEISFFNECLKERISDLEFITGVIEALKAVPHFLTWDILAFLYSVSSDIIRIDILKAMRESDKPDQGFLVSVVKDAGFSLRKEALSALVRNKGDIKEALDILLAIPGFWGRNNKKIVENIDLVDSLDIREAKLHLVALSKRMFFWNRPVRNRALGVLARWEHGKD